MTLATASLSVREAAEQRRSIRAYAPGAVPRADLEEILRLTSLAPSAWNLQPWRFVVVETPERKDQLRATAFGQPQVAAAPAVIVLYTDMAETLATLGDIVRPGTPGESATRFRDSMAATFAAKSPAEREDWAAQQGHIALGYLVLVAQGLGYATSTMGGFEPEKVKALLDLPANARVVALVALGRPAEEGTSHHRHGVERLARFV